jgi:hypothetical protein
MSIPEPGAASAASSAVDFSRPSLSAAAGSGSGQPQRVVVEKVVEKVVTKKGIDENKVRELEESTLKAKRYVYLLM